MDELLKLALQVAPGIAGLVGGPAAGALVGKVADVANSIFGTSDPAQVQAQLATDQAKADAFKAALSSISASDLAQTTTNNKEADSPQFFVAGWRPAVGWVCVVGLAYQFIALPFLTWILACIALLFGKVVPPLPPLDMVSLFQLLGGMLGLGTLRYLDKKAGVDTTSIQKPSFKLFK